MNKNTKFSAWLPFILLIGILLVGAYLRLYRIRDYMGFLGDEGRDALVVKRMLVDHEWTLLGPITSVGLMHLGPLYYYLMLPFLAVFKLDPVGPAVMVALFSLATIVLIYLTCREFLDYRTGIIAALLYSLSPLVITHAHSSWNPNILPFWSLLIIFSMLQVLIKQKFKWWIVLGAAFGVALQLHYITLAFIPIVLASVLINKYQVQIRDLIFVTSGWLLTFSPFIVFEFRHKFINTITIWQFVTRIGDAKTFAFPPVVFKFWDLTVRLFWRLIVIQNAEVAEVFLLTVFSICFLILRNKQAALVYRSTITQLIIWYGVGIITISFYTGIIYDYYLMIVFPLPFFLTGLALSYVNRNNFGKMISILILVYLCFMALVNTPIRKTPNRLAAQAQTISDFILKQTQGSPYNFALIAKQNSDHAYRYFLEVDGQAPVVIENSTIDPDRRTVTDQLFVVCEEKICQPLGYPGWEIAGYGRAEIINEWQVELFRVFKLVKYTGDPT